jgi:hypothetical protein
MLEDFTLARNSWSIRRSFSGGFPQERNELGGFANRRAARCARANQGLRDACVEVRKRFSKRGRERVAGGHSLRGHAQHCLREPVDRIRGPLERGGLRIAALPRDDHFKCLPRVQQRREPVTRRVNPELRRDPRERFKRSFRMFTIARVVGVSMQTVEQDCR